MRAGAPPPRLGQAEHAPAHTRGTQAGRTPTRKGSCWRPQETAPVHRPSPQSKDGRYRNLDTSVTGSTHAKPPQRMQPQTRAGVTRLGQPHRGAQKGYNANLGSAHNTQRTTTREKVPRKTGPPTERSARKDARRVARECSTPEHRTHSQQVAGLGRMP